MVVLAIELSPQYQMQGWIYYLVVQSKSWRFVNIKFGNPLRNNNKYPNSIISLIHYLDDIEY